MNQFKVEDIFFLKDGKVVFAGKYTSGKYSPGLYKLYVDEKPILNLNILGKFHFSPNSKEEIAIYTLDSIQRHIIHLDSIILIQKL